MLNVGHEPAKVVEAVPRAFPFIHVAVVAIRQDSHGGRAVGGPPHDPVLRAYFFARRRLAKAKHVDIKSSTASLLGTQTARWRIHGNVRSILGV